MRLSRLWVGGVLACGWVMSLPASSYSDSGITHEAIIVRHVAPQKYHDSIGFEVPRPVLQRAVTAAANGRNKRPQPEPGPTGQGRAVLWQAPDNIRSRDLFYGPGGKDHTPDSTYTFVKEDLAGSHPKFDVRDENDVKWKVKLGSEARPEVAATRLVWAVGYFANEDYFLPEIQVGNLPARLHRGQKLVGPGGIVRNVRLKRVLEGEKKVGIWPWRANPFVGGRELNGLRAMMALLNNWDSKDVNNSIYEEKHPKAAEGPDEIYMVSDLGSSFGTARLTWPDPTPAGSLKAYAHSRFISKVTPEYVDFDVPRRPAMIIFFNLPEFLSRLPLRSIAKEIPRSDARWIGHLLAQLSPDQVRAAFRAAGYTPDEVDGLAKVVEKRISELNGL